MSVRMQIAPPCWVSAPVFVHCHGKILFLTCSRSFPCSNIFIPLEPPVLFGFYLLFVICSLAEAWCLVRTQVHWQDCVSLFLKHILLVQIMRSYDPSSTTSAHWMQLCRMTAWVATSPSLWWKGFSGGRVLLGLLDSCRSGTIHTFNDSEIADINKFHVGP